MTASKQLKQHPPTRQLDHQRRIEAVRDEWSAAERVARLWQAAERQRELAELMGLAQGGDPSPRRKSFHHRG